MAVLSIIVITVAGTRWFSERTVIFDMVGALQIKVVTCKYFLKLNFHQILKISVLNVGEGYRQLTDASKLHTPSQWSSHSIITS